MKIGIILVVCLVFAFLLAGMALAAKDNETGKAVGKPADNETSAKNMTYGQCVVAGVQIKNACYDTTKQAQADCITNATSDTGKVKQCKADYKKDMKTCKADFKAAKKECIQKTKPGLWQRLRYSMA